jgi:hypothetical protein
MTIETLSVDGTPVEGSHPGRGYQQALTLLEVPLATPLAPGASTTLEVDWSFTVPPAPTFRNGNLDGRVFAVAQWYPRLAVFDDLYGWDQTPYLGDGEFYLDYGDFEVALTVPEGWLIGATGTLQNAEGVLAPTALERLAEARQSPGRTVRVVDEDGRRPRQGTRSGEEGTLTWHFTAEQVRDFAFSTSPDYVWDLRRTEAGVDVHALYRPEFDAWNEAARYAAFTIDTMSEWVLPYPWPQVTITEGPVGGMEYPMLVFNPSTNQPRSLAGVTIHETAHQWFPMIVGSMEAKHPFMDEGFVSYFDEEIASRLWNEPAPKWGETRSYLNVAGTEAEVPILRHTDLVSPYGARGLAAYTKPAVLLGALREMIGRDAFEAAFRDYAANWAWGHPQPRDFFNTMERHAGRSLDPFWAAGFARTDVLDRAIDRVSADADQSVVRLIDQGELQLPTPVRLTFADGRVEDRLVSVDRWQAAGGVVELKVAGRVERVELDPDGLYPDIDASNDVWLASGGS